ncbi:hypothetical protein AB4254_08370 [Vibrio breoganii]
MSFKKIPVIDIKTDHTTMMTLEEVLAIINSERSDYWFDYDSTDWVQGWNEWVAQEGFYKINNEHLHDDYFFDNIPMIINNEKLTVTFEQIKAWADGMGITSKLVEDEQWTCEVNGHKMDFATTTEQEAFLGAFEYFIINNGNIQNFGLFQCHNCDGFFDTTSATQTDEDEQYCTDCA